MDPAALKRQAEEALSGTQDPEAVAAKLGDILKQLARGLDPFPRFMGSWEVFGVEAEVDPAPRNDLGCVIVTQEGELAEFTFSFSPPSPWGDLDRQDRAKGGLGLTGKDYIPYAYAGICALVELYELKRRGVDISIYDPRIRRKK
ncbi:MAG: hypothetical protein HY330_03665 [Chloroflexi bacterium]|nr:hypothetical protein [Chloroflexota bacterium]